MLWNLFLYERTYFLNRFIHHKISSHRVTHDRNHEPICKLCKNSCIVLLQGFLISLPTITLPQRCVKIRSEKITLSIWHLFSLWSYVMEKFLARSRSMYILCIIIYLLQIYFSFGVAASRKIVLASPTFPAKKKNASRNFDKNSFPPVSR